ncbi:hypothetical protein MUN88_06405 [Gracilibacillus caseinilyticus]|uniref:Uncharacterized protein n=1 Tax=Gracilibacillus caseinilyticus TaxID=2932256 RepID=A0ABY4F5G9_9BACI|nr:hypothetical protein [Gracilibacillus caseinilyticus]UOQ49706.1 hypothetical protein MUN88_06405 [Gracilibacillus caseinilyticus]
MLEESKHLKKVEVQEEEDVRREKHLKKEQVQEEEDVRRKQTLEEGGSSGGRGC